MRENDGYKVTLSGQSQEEMEVTARNQRIFTRKIAEKIRKRDETLKPIETEWVNGLLRAWDSGSNNPITFDSATVSFTERKLIAGIVSDWADNIQAPPPKKGRPRTKLLHPSELAMEWAILVALQGKNKSAAFREIAEKYEVDDKYLKDQIMSTDENDRRYGDLALSYIKNTNKG